VLSRLALPVVLSAATKRVKERAFTLSPCGRGWLREAKTGEGFSPHGRALNVDRYPSSGASRHLLPQGEKGRGSALMRQLRRVDAPKTVPHRRGGAGGQHGDDALF